MKLFIPLLDNGNGSVMSPFMRDFFEAFRERVIVFALASDSHPNRGMNKVANAFLKTDCDAWFNVDADTRFRKQDADMLIEHIENDVALVYGIYPKKQEPTEPCFCTFGAVDEPDPKTGLTVLRRCGRGFMLVKREVLEAMKEDNGGPALRYHNHRYQTDGAPEGRAEIEWDFFPSGCVTGSYSALNGLESVENAQLGPGGETLDEDGFPVREWISEDWYFCEMARAVGYPVMVDARIALGHIGLKEYRFSDTQVTRLDSYIKSWREIHGWFDYADLYREIAVKLPDGGTFVEVGCWQGKSIAAMAEELRKLDKHVALHVVDTFEGEPGNELQSRMLAAHGGSVEKIFRGNMKALGISLVDYGTAVPMHAVEDSSRQLIMVHKELSVPAADHFEDQSIDAVFIDGDHSEKQVRADISSYFNKVKAGGIICGHDIDEPGVAAAVAGSFSDFRVQGRCWIYQRDLSLAKNYYAVE
jgi:methyltransferase family protein